MICQLRTIELLSDSGKKSRPTLLSCPIHHTAMFTKLCDLPHLGNDLLQPFQAGETLVP